MEFEDDMNPNGYLFEDENLKRKIDEDLDYAFALVLQSIEDDNLEKTILPPKGESRNMSTSKNMSPVDNQWEVIDPNPNIHALFQQFNAEYFWNTLESVVVEWSKRMTLCAGVCQYQRRAGFCSIRLSQPLLQFRPRKDLVETLLHEMIHAYLFVTHNDRDHDGHGPQFQSHMNRINKMTGARITIYHSFHDEVDYQRKHGWKCDGPCQKMAPYFGIVRRAINRAPSSKDPWWQRHQLQCGGSFHKFQEPENYSVSKSKKMPKKPNHQDIRTYFDFKRGVSNEGSSKPINVLSGNNNGYTVNRNSVKPPDNFGYQSNSTHHERTKVLNEKVKAGGEMRPPPNKSTKKKRSLSSNSTGSRTKTVVISKTETTSNTTVTSRNQESGSGMSQGAKPFQAFSGEGRVLGSAGSSTQSFNMLNGSILLQRHQIGLDHLWGKQGFSKTIKDSDECDKLSGSGNHKKLQCPACKEEILETFINEHLDYCLDKD